MDWCGGLEAELDCSMIREKPADPELRESASVWLFADDGSFAMPRMGIEAVGAVWENHRYDGNFAFPGGRVLRVSKHAPTLSTLAGDGSHSLLGAGGLQFQCVEPFRHWRMRFEDTILESTSLEQIRGNFRVYVESPEPAGARRTPIVLEADLEMAAPGWTQDLRPAALERMTEAERTDAGLMGFGWRVEQVWRGTARLTIDGATREFACTGNRIHRQSVRPMGAFRGHCWQAAHFPDGRAFGYCAYPPREDGSTYNDGYIWQDGRWYKARATRIPFLRNIMPGGDDVSLELESELGITRIAGVTTLGSFSIGNPGTNGMHNNQSAAKYTWDGVETYGMIERSSPVDLCTIRV